jgi:hypothetical protein
MAETHGHGPKRLRVMNLATVRLRFSTASGDLVLALEDGLDGEGEERAAREEIRWIKSLRHATDGTRTLRDAITYRGDSMWWFVEIYLHKRARVRHLFRAALAMETLVGRHQPAAIGWIGGDEWVGPIVAGVANSAGVPTSGVPAPPTARECARTWWQYIQWTTLAVLGRVKSRPRQRSREGGARATRPRIVGYVHTAFWRSASSDDDSEGTEGYLGPVLDALEATEGVGAVPLVGLGPRANFRARRWWHPVADVIDAGAAPPVTPVEAFAPLAALWPSLRFGLHCIGHARWLCAPHMRAACAIRGLDAWPIIREELRGAALLQLPWSARAMDEAGASLDALRPMRVFTYAEAGGWGRALALEARRRGVTCVGLQHGFIYRHWLNYLHEPDEQAASPANPHDVGFPRPTVTLVYDEYAANHLRTAGAFPRDSLKVTGSPALDRLVEGVRSVTPEEQRGCRAALELGDNRVVVVISKFIQIARELPSLLAAAGQVPRTSVVLVPHPAETDEPYQRLARGARDIVVATSHTTLAVLLSVADLVVTVHSTVGLDALTLGVPSLVVGLPTNLSPFVDAGVMAGTRSGELTPALLQSLLDDASRREALRSATTRFLQEFAVSADGHAAHRAAGELSAGMVGGA